MYIATETLEKALQKIDKITNSIEAVNNEVVYKDGKIKLDKNFICGVRVYVSLVHSNKPIITYSLSKKNTSGKYRMVLGQWSMNRDELIERIKHVWVIVNNGEEKRVYSQFQIPSLTPCRTA